MLTTIAFVETKRLILRRFRESDLQDLHEYLSDPEVVAFEPYKPQTLEEVRGNLAWRISTEEMIAVELKETGKLIGNVYLGKRDFDSIFLLLQSRFASSKASGGHSALHRCRRFDSAAAKISGTCDRTCSPSSALELKVLLAKC